MDGHHCPAKYCYNNVPISSEKGPAIQKDPADHRLTSSFGNTMDAKNYRQYQQELVEQGKIREAIQMDIDDIRSKFGNKYDNAINEMLSYYVRIF